MARSWCGRGWGTTDPSARCVPPLPSVLPGVESAPRSVFRGSGELKILEQFKGTTIVSVRRDTEVVIGGDGQVSAGHTVMKANARKVRRLHQDQVLAGFAGGTADAFTLFERFEGALEKYQGNLTRAAVELAKDWRSDRVLRRLEAMLVVADRDSSLIVSGNGDIVEPDDGVIAIGSGGGYAQAAARALMNETELSAKDIVTKSLNIAADICIYTNHHLTIETL